MSKINQFNKPVHSHFEIHTLEWFRENGGELKIIKPCSYGIIWVKSGSGLLTVDLQEYDISNKIVYCMKPGQLRRIESHSNTDGYYISFSPDFYYGTETEFNFSFLTSGNKDGKYPFLIQMDEEIQREVEEVLIKMSKEFNNHFSLRVEVLKGLFRIFLLYLSRNFVVDGLSGSCNRDKDLVRRFILLLGKNFITKKMVADYAGELNITPSYLNQVVKKVSGFTASYHIRQYLVREAKKQAIHSNCSMKEIAYGLGFDDTAHFSKFFKNISGVNFTHFKKEIFCMQ